MQLFTATQHHDGKHQLNITNNIIITCTSRWLSSLSRSAAMLFFTCCRAVRSFLRELGLHPKTEIRVNRKIFLYLLQVMTIILHYCCHVQGHVKLAEQVSPLNH